jgi:hypothetical protein
MVERLRLISSQRGVSVAGPNAAPAPQDSKTDHRDFCTCYVLFGATWIEAKAKLTTGIEDMVGSLQLPVPGMCWARCSFLCLACAGFAAASCAWPVFLPLLAAAAMLPGSAKLCKGAGCSTAEACSSMC